MLHLICTRLRPGHLSLRVGDSSRRSEETVKKSQIAPFVIIIIVIIIIIIIIITIIIIISSSSSSSSSSGSSSGSSSIYLSLSLFINIQTQTHTDTDRQTDTHTHTHTHTHTQLKAFPPPPPFFSIAAFSPHLPIGKAISDAFNFKSYSTPFPSSRCHFSEFSIFFPFPSFHRLVGLVIKASASRAEDPGFESRLRRDFFGVESYQ